jgi:hypothetical protein
VGVTVWAVASTDEIAPLTAGRLKILLIVDVRPPALNLHVVHPRWRSLGKGRWLIGDIHRRLTEFIHPELLQDAAE